MDAQLYLPVLGACTCSTCSTCGTYYKIALVLSLFLTILSCIGFIVSEVIPKSYSGKTFIYEDSIILIERVDPTFYSDIKVKKLNDRQDHLLYVYFVLCSNIIVENHDISLNATFSTNTNIMLLPRDAMFLIEDSQLQLEYAILNSGTTPGWNFFVVSSDVHTLIAFKHNNSVIKDTKSFKFFNISLTSDEVSTISYDFDKTGYYYIGFSPSGNTTLHIDYELHGYNYVRPSIGPSCTLHKLTDTCSIKVPERLTNSYGNDYCLLGEVVSNPYITDQVLVDVQYKVEHNGKWNFITIMFLTIFLSSCSFNLAMITYWCACYRITQRNRKHYFSIQ